jgi:hypothetical protein
MRGIKGFLGIVPKTYLPNDLEFSEKRQFNSGRNGVRSEQPFLRIECARRVLKMRRRIILIAFGPPVAFLSIFKSRALG